MVDDIGNIVVVTVVTVVVNVVVSCWLVASTDVKGLLFWLTWSWDAPGLGDTVHSGILLSGSGDCFGPLETLLFAGIDMLRLGDMGLASLDLDPGMPLLTFLV